MRLGLSCEGEVNGAVFLIALGDVHMPRVRVRVRVKSGLLAMTWHAIIQPNLITLVST